MRGVLSVSVTLRYKGSHYRITLWTGGLYAVSVMLTLGFRLLWLLWRVFEANKAREHKPISLTARQGVEMMSCH